MYDLYICYNKLFGKGLEIKNFFFFGSLYLLKYIAGNSYTEAGTDLPILPVFPRFSRVFDHNPGFPDSALEFRVFMNAQIQTRYEHPNHDVPTSRHSYFPQKWSSGFTFQPISHRF